VDDPRYGSSNTITGSSARNNGSYPMQQLIKKAELVNVRREKEGRNEYIYIYIYIIYIT
jgi:hypothetical protein